MCLNMKCPPQAHAFVQLVPVGSVWENYETFRRWGFTRSLGADFEALSPGPTSCSRFAS